MMREKLVFYLQKKMKNEKHNLTIQITPVRYVVVYSDSNYLEINPSNPRYPTGLWGGPLLWHMPVSLN